MTSSLTRFATAEQEQHLPWPHIVYGLVAFVIFLALLGVLFAFRNTATKLGDAQRERHGRH